MDYPPSRYIRRYAIVNEEGETVACYLDKDRATLFASEANRGLYRKMGLLSLKYKVEERKVEVAKTTGTLFF